MRTTRVIAMVVTAAGAVLLAALPASAHVETDPSRVKPGKTVTVEFAPEHGCGESVTTEMRFLVPAGVKKARPVAPEGWSAKVKGRTITFLSEKVPDQEAAFGITFTAPTTRTLLAWKVVQTCQTGVERWLDGPRGDHPAPVVGVGRNPPKTD